MIGRLNEKRGAQSRRQQSPFEIGFQYWFLSHGAGVDNKSSKGRKGNDDLKEERDNDADQDKRYQSMSDFNRRKNDPQEKHVERSQDEARWQVTDVLSNTGMEDAVNIGIADS